MDGSEIIVDNGFSISYSDMPETQLVSVHYLNASTTYEIELKEIPVQDIIVNNDSLTLFIGDRKRIAYKTLPSNSVAHNVKVISDNEDIIKIVNNKMIA
ncbi:MAG: hypothetical protein IJQ50_04470, partial [Clostridia bacterium]|nr:hypothetical protein [Clostridia bacterium]